MQQTLALIGFGEAAAAFALAGQWGAGARAFDINPARTAAMRHCGVAPSDAPAACLAGAPLVLSLVTADQALAAALSCAPSLAAGAIWCDMNSVSPDTKRAAAKAIAAAGGCYVDAAVLAPVPQAGMGVPLLLAGEAAARAEGMLRAAGFENIRVAGGGVGSAAAIKLIRSVMVKGIEALTAEMILAARAAGVEEEVLASLDASEKPQPWAARAAYNIERMVNHGSRRATEMEESAATLAALGVEPMMTRGTVLRQRGMAGRAEHLAGPATRDDRRTVQ